MRTPEDNIQLANLLFPDVLKIPDEVEKMYPDRNLGEGAMVLRFAPSPTGFLHIGSVYTGMLCTILAKQSNGISILRIEDTDKNREVENGVSTIVEGLKGFGINFDEGMTSETNSNGGYGPYMQSQRLDIYGIYAKDMVSKGNAYPCFITEEELGEIRKKQEEMGVRTGYYGQWAKWRDASLEEIQEKINNGEKFAIRLYSTGNIENTFHVKDLVKGELTLRENDMDAVLLKSDGFPTYHFAHPVDDHLMRITHVTRGDEWLASEPLHRELFEKLGFELLPYGHFAPLSKLDERKKRKLSKRKDPEADVQYYIEKGYPKEGVKEYLLNIANSNFYDWKIQNPDKTSDEFVLRFEKFNKAGALFDIVKLDDICKDYIALLSAQEVYDMALEWANVYNSDVASLLKDNKEYCISIFNIERVGKKVRKDLVKFEDIKNQLTIFFDELFATLGYENISEKIDAEKQKEIVKTYLEIFKLEDSVEIWFEGVKNLAEKFQCSAGEVAMILRVAVTGKTKSPDLYQIFCVLGEKKVIERLERYQSSI